MVRRDPVMMAWAAGLGLAAVVYVIGPDRFLFRLDDTLHLLAWRVAEAVAELSATALDAVRALAIGLYATFVALALAVARRGGRSRMAVAVVTVVFFLLLSGAGPEATTRWVAAMILSGVGAAMMTGRLRQSGLPSRV